jgi:outer membrane protein OmpA-like peptidoglycan-associated protein
MRATILAVFVIAIAAAIPAYAQDQRKPTESELIERLKTGPQTRGFAVDARGIKVEGAATPAENPSVDLDVNFEFNSTALTTDAMLTLDQLGQALKNEALAQQRFQLAGHTDAVGGDKFNQALSEKRAAAVREYLITRHGIAAGRLDAIGFGRTQLLDPQHPDGAVNRRVQVTNLGG